MHAPSEGLLLRQLRGDAALSRYDVVIVDEVHERHAPGDLLLALLRAVRQRRPALKIVLMSATVDAERFQAFFGGAAACPLVRVPGRLWPVTVEYVPPRGLGDNEVAAAREGESTWRTRIYSGVSEPKKTNEKKEEEKKND